MTAGDLDRPVATHGLPGPPIRPLRDVLDTLRTTYCRSIGVQFMHIDDRRAPDVAAGADGGRENRTQLTREEQLRILTRLTDAVIFEEFIQQEVPGAKSFSLEGAESLIPLLDLAIEKAGRAGDRRDRAGAWPIAAG